MTRHYPGLDSALDHRLLDWSCRMGYLLQPIRSTTQVWEVTRYQDGISALASQTSFRGETIGSVAKCRLFSQATLYLCRLKPCPHLGRRTQVLATPFGLSRDFFGFSKQSEVRWCCRGIPAPNINIPFLTQFSFYIIYCFLQIFRARKFVMVFWGVKFWSRDILRFCWKP